ncbi:MAG: DUF4292 domain-containing protein [Bacteroidales bacterium]|jgi:hypothetical protein|nr:DUF4292 domain-containing protein [Bacteroidales bacterium]
MKRLIFFIAISLLFVGCKVQSPQADIQSKQTADKQNQTTFETYTTKISGTYNSIPFKGQVRLQKDSVIWVSLTGFGFEAARLLMTKDSVFAINKLQKEVLIGDYNTLEQHFGLPLSFAVAQKVLLDTAQSSFKSEKQMEVQFLPQGVTTINRFTFPKQLTTKAKLNNRLEEITIKFSDQQINVPISIPFSIPKDYDTIK